MSDYTSLEIGFGRNSTSDGTLFIGFTRDRSCGTLNIDPLDFDYIADSLEDMINV